MPPCTCSPTACRRGARAGWTAAGAVLAGAVLRGAVRRRRVAGRGVLELLRTDRGAAHLRSVRCECWSRLAAAALALAFVYTRAAGRETRVSGALGVAALLALLALGVPIGVAMGLVGLVGLTLLLGPEPALIKSSVVLFETVTRYELGVLPLFLLMAHLCFAAGASRDFFDAAAQLRRPPARRPGARDHRRLRRVRRGQRLEPGDRGHDRPDRPAGDAPARLFRPLRHRLGRGRRHARLADAALGRAHRLRHHRRTIDRQAVHRRDHSGRSRRRCSTWWRSWLLCRIRPRHRAAIAARPVARTGQGHAARAGSRGTRGHRARGHRHRLVHAHRSGLDRRDAGAGVCARCASA